MLFLVIRKRRDLLRFFFADLTNDIPRKVGSLLKGFVSQVGVSLGHPGIFVGHKPLEGVRQHGSECLAHSMK